MENISQAQLPGALAEVQRSPWRTIWWQPRASVRYIANWDTEYGVFAITSLTGIVYIIAELIGNIQEDNPLSILLYVPVLLLAGPAYGFMNLYVGGFFLGLVGSWFGGKAGGHEIRCAIAWSNVPMVTALPPALAVLILAIVMPGLEKNQPGLGEMVLYLVFVLVGAGAVLWLYSWGLLVATFAEIQGLSLRRSLSTIVVANLLFWGFPFLLLLGAA